MKVEGLNKWIKEWYDQNEADLNALMQDVWAHPEVGLYTKHAAEAAYKFATTHGFPDAVLSRAGQGIKPHENPNAVVAEYGSGKPVIVIVGELDALPGLGNDNVPYRKEIEGPGQGCGHNLIAGACMGAACALRYAMEKEGVKGTLRMVEAPGEEVGRGKHLLIRDGVLNDADMAIMWHPGSDAFNTEPQDGMCIIAANFEFHGKSAHAAGGPWNGRSALDAVQLMNMGCEFLREHVTTDCRLHYQITNGGMAPNIVPDYASVKYFCRAGSTRVDKDLYERVCKCAEGAAHMTDTTVDIKPIFLIPAFYTNDVLCEYLFKISQEIPDIPYTAEDYKFAREITEAYTGEPAPEKDEDVLKNVKRTYEGKMDKLTATDMQDMSYFCPTAHIHGSGIIAKAPGHHWTNTACSGTPLGQKAAIRAGKVLAEGAFEAFGDPEAIKSFWDYQKTLDIPDYWKDVYTMKFDGE